MNEEDMQIAFQGARDSLSLAFDCLKIGNREKAEKFIYQATIFLTDAETAMRRETSRLDEERRWPPTFSST